MGLATSFLQGSKEEWSLVRRHPSERIFGVQFAGSKPGILASAAETFAREFGPSKGIDFVDLNCGCPIDLVFRSGSGSARECVSYLCNAEILDISHPGSAGHPWKTWEDPRWDEQDAWGDTTDC